MKTLRSRNASSILAMRHGVLSVVSLLGCVAGVARAQVPGPHEFPPVSAIDVADPATGRTPVEAVAVPVTERELPPYLQASGQQAVLEDPWERYNRRVFRFNSAVDRVVGRPIARAYVRRVPSPVRIGVTHFFQNLQQVPTAANLLLQGDVPASAVSIGRLALNTTVGVAGVFDPATRMRIPLYREDFGQTLARWGWHHSRYLLVPFLGPGTLRDDLGRLVDSQASVYPYVHPVTAQATLVGASFVDLRSRSLYLDDLASGVDDRYALIRDAWGQYRAYEIEHDGRASRMSDP